MRKGSQFTEMLILNLLDPKTTLAGFLKPPYLLISLIYVNASSFSDELSYLSGL